MKQILGETLEYFTVSKGDDEGLRALGEVWAKEKKNVSARTPPPIPSHPSFNPVPRTRSPPGLPPITELVARISEAQTSASLLTQVLQSTPQVEVPTNELVKEFADRCKAASRSMVAYISADPPPDEDTLTTLIETNEVLGGALATWRKVVNEAQKAALEAGRGRGDSARIVDVIDVGPGFLEEEHDRRGQGPPSPVSPVVSTRIPCVLWEGQGDRTRFVCSSRLFCW